MSNKKFVTLFLLITASWAMNNVAFAQVVASDKEQQDKSQASIAQAKKNLVADFLWTTQPWENKDAPYKRITDNIDRAINNGANPDRLRQSYAVLARQRPNNPEDLFRWAYAAYQSGVTPHHTFLESEEILDDAFVAFSKQVIPMTYHTARLQFLCDANGMAFTELRNIGERLLKKNPADAEVEWHIAAILNDSNNSADRQQAFSYMQDLVKKSPKRPGTFTLLGGYYYTSWCATKNKADAEHAIDAYQQALRLAPAQYGFRQKAELLIEIMKKG